jgi:type IV secretory pathway VirB4 component
MAYPKQNPASPTQQFPSHPSPTGRPLPPNSRRPVKPNPNDPEVVKRQLSRLSPSQLKRDVIRTEIDIQRTLVQSEKQYRQGISTIRDLIAPSSVNIKSGYIELGTKLARSFFVLTYPRIISSGWLEGIVNSDMAMDLSIFIYPRDSSQVLRELRGKVGRIQASLQFNAEKGVARDPALQTAYRDVESLRDAIQQGVEKFFRVGVYMTIYADTNDQLERISKDIESLLNQQNIIVKNAALQMDDGFNSCLPIQKDDLNVIYNLNTGPLSACFPFVSSELSGDSGILYGINRHNSSLIIFDRFELENANCVVFATSGAGKSYTVKLEILRSLMLGVNVLVIDPEQEYKILSDTLGGAYVHMSLNSSNRLNPFDLPKPLPGENQADILRSAIIDLMGLMNLMLGKLNPREVSIMERAIKESYAKRDITENADFSRISPPTMGDLVEILNGIVGGEDLAQRLYRYTEGTFAGIFNQSTNINVNNELIIFNIRDLQETLRPIAMYIILKHIWNEIRSKLRRRLLAIDEAWIMMQYEDSARFLYGIAKRARKYYLGVTTITQDVGDFLNSPFGKPIVTNAAMKILLKQSTAAIDLIADTFALTSGEKQVLLQSDVGQGIFFAGAKHVAIEIIAFPTEHRIITTNPKDLVKIQEFGNEI